MVGMPTGDGDGDRRRRWRRGHLLLVLVLVLTPTMGRHGWQSQQCLVRHHRLDLRLFTDIGHPSWRDALH
jgi:hypothetical protein